MKRVPAAASTTTLTAENTGMTCQFIDFNEVVNRHQGGTVERTDVHLDRMAANTGMTCAFTVSVKRQKAVDVPASTTPAATPDLARVKLKP